MSADNDDHNSNSNDDDYDAATALLMRGAFLKKLRELERQDDEERQRMASFMEEDEAETATSNTLRYSTYLANQRGVYDDYKHVNYEFIEFDNKSNQDAVPLTIQQDRKVGKGGFPQKVIELGSGTGVTGLLTAQAYPMAQVHLTDLPQLQPLLEGNAKLNSTLQNVTTGVLEWGSKTTNEAYDVILAADVVAGIYDGQALIKSLYDLAHSKTQIFLSCNEGRLAGIIDAFIGELKERFEVVERRQPHSDNRNPNIIVFVISGKREFQ
ncbi:MAG: hypothetical protein SGARI_006862 [Bacillariaceae sp.]